MMFDLLHPKEPQHLLALLCHAVHAVSCMSAVYKFLIKFYLITWLSDCSIDQLVLNLFQTLMYDCIHNPNHPGHGKQDNVDLH